MRRLLFLLAALSLTACVKKEARDEGQSNGWADYSLVRTCASGREIYQTDKGLATWNSSGGFWIPVAANSDLDEVCGVARAPE